MENKPRNILGPIIKYYRKKLNLTQDNLIARLSINGLPMEQAVLSRIENQEREIYDYEIIIFAEALQITINELFVNYKNDTFKTL